MKKLSAILLASLFFAACGGAAETNKASNATNAANANSTNTAVNKASVNSTTTSTNPTGFTLKIDGKEMPVDAKFASYTVEKATISRGGKDETAAQYVFRIANFDFQNAKGKQPTGDEKMAIFTIVNIPNTDEKTVPGAGDYPVPLFAGEQTPQFSITTKLGVMYIDGGKPIEKKLETSKLKGKTKITSATADTISGEIDATDGATTIKGTFTAKLTKK